MLIDGFPTQFLKGSNRRKANQDFSDTFYFDKTLLKKKQREEKGIKKLSFKSQYSFFRRERVTNKDLDGKDIEETQKENY